MAIFRSDAWPCKLIKAKVNYDWLFLFSLPIATALQLTQYVGAKSIDYSKLVRM